jgi:predicted phage-related endonuclease
MEPHIIHTFSDIYNTQVIHVDNIIMVNPKFPILQASLDGIMLDTSGTKPAAIIECKAVSPNGVRLWNKGVPLYYQAQVQFYMHVLEIEYAYVLALYDAENNINFDSSKLKVFPIRYDKELGKRIQTVAYNFWNNHIIPGICP